MASTPPPPQRFYVRRYDEALRRYVLDEVTPGCRWTKSTVSWRGQIKSAFDAHLSQSECRFESKSSKSGQFVDQLAVRSRTRDKFKHFIRHSTFRGLDFDAAHVSRLPFQHRHFAILEVAKCVMEITKDGAQFFETGTDESQGSPKCACD